MVCDGVCVWVWCVVSNRNPHEIWVPLLEKAYAKLHGSYAALQSGNSGDAFADLTGGGPERLNIKQDQGMHSVYIEIFICRYLISLISLISLITSLSLDFLYVVVWDITL
jgi:hypothetical protein